MAQPYIGEIRMFAGNYPPLGWEFCEGQLIPIAENDTLFIVLGTRFGGDGETTFALPDLRGRLPLHRRSTSYVVGDSGGVEEVTLSVNQIPNHRHPMQAVGGRPGTDASPTGNVPAMSLHIAPYTTEAATGTLNPSAVTAVGGSQPHTNLQPYLCVNFIISMFGLFPSAT